jgi:hypothetical protein
LESNLEKLGYSTAWLDIGIISENLIIEEMKKFYTDPHPEHWRYRNLVNFLKNKIFLNDNEFDGILLIIYNDPDKAMITSFCIEMMHKLSLTSNQMIQLEIFFKLNNNYELFFREDLKTKLANDEVDISIFNRIVLNEKFHHLIYEFSNNINLLEILIAKTSFKKLKNKIFTKLNELKGKSKTRSI